MAFCQKCGAAIEEGTNFCAACGASAESGSAQQDRNAFDQMTQTEDVTSDYSAADIDGNKVMAVLSYLGILVLVPIFAAKNSPYARFHANQGLTIFLAEIAYSVLSGILNNIVGSFALSAILSLVNILFLVLSIMGIVNAVTGKAKKLPITGGITLLK